MVPHKEHSLPLTRLTVQELNGVLLKAIHQCLLFVAPAADNITGRQSLPPSSMNPVY